MKKKPRFFCDNCGHEVNNSTRACPHCGRFFTSIRCPSCGFSGEDKLFLKGCPSCGYSDTAGKQKPQEKPPAQPSAFIYIISIALLIAIAFLAYFITR